MSSSRIPELSVIPFNGSESIAAYSKALRKLAHDLAFELDMSADEIQAVLATLKGHPLLLGLDVKLRARRVANRLRRAKECAQGMASEAVKFNAQYRREFIAPAEEAKRKKSKRDWEF